MRLSKRLLYVTRNGKCCLHACSEFFGNPKKDKKKKTKTTTTTKKKKVQSIHAHHKHKPLDNMFEKSMDSEMQFRSSLAILKY